MSPKFSERCRVRVALFVTERVLTDETLQEPAYGLIQTCNEFVKYEEKEKM
jgi:hypothetical protein